jgi:hypothetical protein
MTIDIKKGTTNVTVYVKVIDSTAFVPETTVLYTTGGVDLWYMREGSEHVDITETGQTAAGAHADGGFVHIADGICRLDLPDAACAAGVDHVYVGGTFTSMIVQESTINLVDYDPFDTVRLGLTALPNAVVDAAGGLPMSDAGGLDLDALNTNVAAIKVQTDALPESITKNATFAFSFKMVDATDGFTLETGLTVTGTRSIDGAAFTAITGTIAEIAAASGIYRLSGATADSNGTEVVFKFASAGARTKVLIMRTAT